MTEPHPGTTTVRLRPDRAGRLEAQLLAAGPHLEPVLDVGRAPNGDLLLEVPTAAARLSELLPAPGWPSPGEAVTVLVPLATALADLHAAGVAHAGIAADAVLLDADGSPSWAGPDEPVLRRRAGEAAFSAAASADVAAFRALCDGLLGGAGARVPDTRDLAGLASALFAIAEPVPVRLRPDPVPVASGPPSRLVPAAPPPATERRAPVLLPAARAALRTVRLRVWLAAGSVAVLLAVLPVLLPAHEPTPTAASASSSPGVPSTVPAPTVAATTAPRAALRALVTARARCLLAGSERCLAVVDAAGSPVLEADVAAVRAGSEAPAVDPTRLRMRSGSGGLALADASGTTVLAVREPDGWRLRDVAPPAP